jgi:ubiquinone/menaquinone biosynthesis C-methylase UbiE
MGRDGDPYAFLAEVYDNSLVNDAIFEFYREWQRSLLESIERSTLKVQTLVDLCCGTGNSTIAWALQPGWKVLGIDSSSAMLRRAKAKSSRVTWVKQDLRNLKLDIKADVVTCHFDALNHILSLLEMRRCLGRISRIMNSGGLFQFDLNTEAMFQWLHEREKLFQVPAGCFVASNFYDCKRRIVTFQQLWFLKKGALYRLRRVKVRERAFTTREIKDLLLKSGMRLLDVKTQREIEGKPARLIYIAQKR